MPLVMAPGMVAKSALTLEMQAKTIIVQAPHWTTARDPTLVTAMAPTAK